MKDYKLIALTILFMASLAILFNSCAKPDIKLKKDESVQCMDGMYYVVSDQRVKLYRENGKTKECESGEVY